ncbi:hypothetical protein LTR53_002286 [Teratosphaeriaceae sp. CCFEE 6253]|nr:hypothetical protein LTR53_002286 [Teratosphaeriaceae sp. CCFEE 6253]
MADCSEPSRFVPYTDRHCGSPERWATFRATRRAKYRSDSSQPNSIPFAPSRTREGYGADRGGYLVRNPKFVSTYSVADEGPRTWDATRGHRTPDSHNSPNSRSVPSHETEHSRDPRQARESDSSAASACSRDSGGGERSAPSEPNYAYPSPVASNVTSLASRTRECIPSPHQARFACCHSGVTVYFADVYSPIRYGRSDVHPTETAPGGLGRDRGRAVESQASSSRPPSSPGIARRSLRFSAGYPEGAEIYQNTGSEATVLRRDLSPWIRARDVETGTCRLWTGDGVRHRQAHVEPILQAPEIVRDRWSRNRVLDRAETSRKSCQGGYSQQGSTHSGNSPMSWDISYAATNAHKTRLRMTEPVDAGPAPIQYVPHPHEHLPWHDPSPNAQRVALTSSVGHVPSNPGEGEVASSGARHPYAAAPSAHIERVAADVQSLRLPLSTEPVIERLQAPDRSRPAHQSLRTLPSSQRSTIINRWQTSAAPLGSPFKQEADRGALPATLSQQNTVGLHYSTVRASPVLYGNMASVMGSQPLHHDAPPDEPPDIVAFSSAASSHQAPGSSSCVRASVVDDLWLVQDKLDRLASQMNCDEDDVIRCHDEDDQEALGCSPNGITDEEVDRGFSCDRTSSTSGTTSNSSAPAIETDSNGTNSTEKGGGGKSAVTHGPASHPSSHGKRPSAAEDRDGSGEDPDDIDRRKRPRTSSNEDSSDKTWTVQKRCFIDDCPGRDPHISELL